MHNSLIKSAQRRLTNAWPVHRVRSRLTAPIASITFDDFPHSAWTAGGRALEEQGFRGTYFVSAAFSPDKLRRQPAAGSILGAQYYEADDLIAAHLQGHEIGCHTYDHINTPLLNDVELAHSIQQNAQFVRDLLGDAKMTSFAFPQGAVNIRTKRLFSKHFSVCRGTWPGMNAGLVDLALLKSIALDADFARGFDLARLVAAAKATNAWLIFYAHDIGPQPSPWGCTTRVFERLLATLQREGIDVLTLREAATRVVHGEASIANTSVLNRPFPGQP
jgi:peptidoglycan/xylan/chitin deacetylase (PgdA/CDA1 family)